MRILYLSITLLTALVMLALAGSFILHKKGVGPDIGIWTDPPTEIFYDQIAKVPVKDGAKLASPVQNPNWARSGFKETQFLRAVLIGPPEFAFPFPLDFNQGSRGGERSLFEGGGCGAPTVNLVKLDPEGKAAKPVFGRRLLISRYAYLQAPNVERLIALVIDADTNRDGFYSCDDAAKLQFISLIDGSVKTIPRSFHPMDMSHLDFDSTTQTVIFVERSTDGEKVRQTMLTISFDGEILSEEVLPDMLSEARRAFENTASD